MSEANADLESILARAEGREKEYDWREAASIYDRALGLIRDGDSRNSGRVREARARALFQHAFQAAKHEEFIERLDAASTEYSKAKEVYSSPLKNAWTPGALRCDGMIAYLGFWQSSKADEKRMRVNEAWKFAKKALLQLGSPENGAEFCRTYNQLSPVVIFAVHYDDDFEHRRSMVHETSAFGNQALSRMSHLSDLCERAMVCIRASCFTEWEADYFSEPDEGQKLEQAARDLWEKARTLSEEVTLLESTWSFVTWFVSVADEPGIDDIARRALEYAKKTDDKLLIGSAWDWLAQRSYFRLPRAADQEELEQIAASSYDLSLKARKEFSLIHYVPPSVIWVWSPCAYPGHCAHLSFFVTDPKRKRELAERVIENEPEIKERATESGYPEVIYDVEFIATMALTCLAKTEHEPEKRRKLLEEATRRGTTQNESWSKLHPLHYGSQSSSGNIVADTAFEIASLESDPSLKKERLRNALLLRGKAVELAKRYMSIPSSQEPRIYHYFAMWQAKYAACAQGLYELTGEKSDLEDTIRSYEDAAESYRKGDLPNRTAECLWRSARAHDRLGEHQMAAERFSQAAEQYRTASEKVPPLKVLYEDHSRYMEAWCEIELAKLRHTKQEHGTSRDHYEKAAALLASTDRWRYLSANYYAWSSVEKGEELSRVERGKDAIAAFGNAEARFEESRKSIETRVSRAQDDEEDAMASALLKVADLRGNYCRARAIIEEARLLDRRGQESASSERYGQAAEVLERIRERLKGEQDRKEIGLVITLTKAWQMMTQAEAEASPDLFSKASELFEQAKDLSPNDKAKSTAMGHSRFCKALAAGTKFSDTCEASLHIEATKHLERAAKHYLKAGHEKASEYAHASKLLFDSYVYMDKATREDDQVEKARLYTLAEKVLEASATSYEQADYPGKKEEVLKLLAKVRRDRQLALSLTEALRAPDIVSTTAGFDTPTSTHETAIGLERFEHADVQGTVIARPMTLNVGEALRVEIELVNAGKGLAQLTKLEEVAPNGFEVVETPQKYRMEDTYLNLRGKHLDALRTEEIRVVMKPNVQGQFMLKPRIMYIDDSGKYRSHEPEPVEVKVKEMGIAGWLKGPEKRL